MSALDRRRFLGTSLGSMALTFGPAAYLRGKDKHKSDEPVHDKPPADDPRATFRPDTLFLTWQRDPTTTMTVQWIGRPEETDSTVVAFAPREKSDGKPEWQSVTPRETAYPMTDLRLFRAELTKLRAGNRVPISHRHAIADLPLSVDAGQSDELLLIYLRRRLRRESARGGQQRHRRQTKSDVRSDRRRLGVRRRTSGRCQLAIHPQLQPADDRQPRAADSDGRLHRQS